MPEVDAVGQLAQLDEQGCRQHFIDQSRGLLHGQQHDQGGALHHRDAPDHGVLVVPLQLHDQGHGQYKPHGVGAQRLQTLYPLGTLHHQRRQQGAGQQTRGPRIEAEKDFVELLALHHPEDAPQRTQQPQRRKRRPDSARRGLAQQQNQQRRPDQIEMLLHRQRPHMQQRVRTVEEGNAVIGQVEDGDQGVRIDIRKVWPDKGGEQAVREQEKRQRRHEPEEAAAVKAPVIELAMLPILHQQQGGDQKTAEHEEQIDAEEGAIEHRGMCMREQHQHNGYASQSIERWVVAQLERRLHQNRTPFLSPRHGPGLQTNNHSHAQDMAEAVFRV